MKTDELIRSLASDIEAPQWRGPAVLAALAAAAVSLTLYAIELAPRPDIAAALATPRFVLKMALVLALALLAVRLMRAVFYPQAPTAGPLRALWLVPALLAIAVVGELWSVDATAWLARLVGTNAVACLTFIPLLSLPLLAAALFGLTYGAPTRPRLAGAAAGLLAGALGGALYGTHCPDDSPLFVATWYPLGIGVVTLIGALVGARVLRW